MAVGLHPPPPEEVQTFGGCTEDFGGCSPLCRSAGGGVNKSLDECQPYVPLGMGQNLTFRLPSHNIKLMPSLYSDRSLYALLLFTASSYLPYYECTAVAAILHVHWCRYW